MKKTIFITGSTDGIGLEVAKKLVSQGHRVLLHGRNPAKLEKVERALSALSGGGQIETYVTDLSLMSNVKTLAKTVLERHDKLDVLINNAGVYKTTEPITQEGLDIRFAVNTLAPYLLTQLLLPLLGTSSRVINVSSAAQMPVNLDALAGRIHLSDEMAVYAQSKLAITMSSHSMALAHKDGPAFISINPGSLLATKMVKEGFGIPGNDIQIGVDILVRAALSVEFENATGKYFDNDAGKFTAPHIDTQNKLKSEQLTLAIETVVVELT